MAERQRPTREKTRSDRERGGDGERVVKGQDDMTVLYYRLFNFKII